jgi:4-hydroxybenzoate polyprenyltransferase
MIGSNIDWRGASPLSRASLALGVAAVIAFFVFGFAVGGWWFLLALVAGSGAFVLGHVARGREHRRSALRFALTGMVLGALVVVCFAAYVALGGAA